MSETTLRTTFCLTFYAIWVNQIVFIESMNDNEVMAYLEDFQYAGANNPDTRIADMMSVDPSEAMFAGCLVFQERYDLKMTGNCYDDTSMAMMSMPRCGLPDITTMEDMMSYDMMMDMMRKKRRQRSTWGKRMMRLKKRFGKRKKRYNLQGSNWAQPHLTWTIISYPIGLAASDVDRDFTAAFDFWALHSPLTFTRTQTQPLIVISFVPRIHGDGLNFDGPHRVLAHTFFPQSGGDGHFDNEETWTVDQNFGYNVFQVAIHEIGHALGLGHSGVSTALMAPFYHGYAKVEDYQLPDDDIAAIQALYGKPSAKLDLAAKAIDGRTMPPESKISAMGDTICIDLTFDAICQHVVSGESKTFAFIGKMYIELNDYGLQQGYPRLISLDWSGIETVDACLTFQGFGSVSKTYLFAGTQYYVFNNKLLVNGHPQPITDNWGLPNDLDSAFQWSKNGLIYFTKDNEYYRYTSYRQTAPDAGYPRPLTDWNAIFLRLDAAFQFKTRKTYFFLGPNFYKFNDSSFKVEDGFPKLISTMWLGCRSDDPITLGSSAVRLIADNVELHMIRLVTVLFTVAMV